MSQIGLEYALGRKLACNTACSADGDAETADLGTTKSSGNGNTGSAVIDDADEEGVLVFGSTNAVIFNNGMMLNNVEQ
ncbi:chitin deacetylase [Mucor velutinosus]|uniref:Chitin deacetylase n=1 Tax=Mucor velutinosus TaxID=708070 RepID=A0AAN7I3U9_9FUNG|nr:chitin deacetylase [Mucor velutinosus]